MLRYQKQAYRHKPDEGIFGDCERTAYAVLLGMHRDNVPHFSNGVRDDDIEACKRADAQRDQWLAGRGLSRFLVVYYGDDLQAVLECVSNCNGEDFCYLLTGTSKTGCNHVVVCRGNRIVWDTSIDDSGIIGPANDGFYWVEVFVPSFMRDSAPASEDAA
jgi:hypothetical protein